MNFPLQEILEQVMVGAIVVALLLAVVVVLLGQNFPSYLKPVARPVERIFLRLPDGDTEDISAERDRGSESNGGNGNEPQGPQGKDPANSSSFTLGDLSFWFAGLLLLAVFYIVGIGAERISDQLDDPKWPVVSKLVVDRTDKRIRIDTFRERFEAEWPEPNNECLPYTDDEITNTYYTAVNYLKQKPPASGELLNIQRRIRFGESLRLVGVGGFVVWFFLTIIVVFFALAHRRRDKVTSAPGGKNPKPRGGSSRARRVETQLVPIFATGIALFLLAWAGSFAWELDEERFDQRVFGYYLTALSSGGDNFRRAPINETRSLAVAADLLEGAHGDGVGRFDASGVAWLRSDGTPEDPDGRNSKSARDDGDSDQRMIVVNDKDSRLTVHAKDGSLTGEVSLPVDAFGQSGLRDLEAITPAGNGQFHLLASHSTWIQAVAPNKPIDPARQNLFTIRLSRKKGGKEMYALELVDTIPLKDHLALTCLDADGLKCLLEGWKEQSVQNAGCCNVNIEAMAMQADGKHLLLGFREPLLCVGGRPVTPIYRLPLERAKDPGPLELAGLVPADVTTPWPQRISDMAYDRNNERYVIVTSYEHDGDAGMDTAAAPCDLRGIEEMRRAMRPGAGRRAVAVPALGGALWLWDGNLGSMPELVGTTVQHKPEGVAVDGNGEIVIVFDDDERADLPSPNRPYAYFSLLKELSAPYRPHCAPLVPANDNE